MPIKGQLRPTTDTRDLHAQLRDVSIKRKLLVGFGWVYA